MNWYKKAQKRISYSGVVLDDDSKSKLLSSIPEELLNQYDQIVAHHMTINLGELEDKTDLGKEVGLVASHLGKSDKALAVQVNGYPSKNEVPHITVAISKKRGGRPKDSNNIEDWTPIPQGIYLKGIVSEVEFS